MEQYTIIDAHAHLWLKQQATVNGKQVRSGVNGRAEFLGEEVQMIPPFILDGRNSAEIFLSNMDYAQVGGAVITQEYIDGDQNDYLCEVAQMYPDRFFVCGMAEFRQCCYLSQTRQLVYQGFKLVQIPAQSLITASGRSSVHYGYRFSQPNPLCS